jgi:hypothetical protein
VNYARRQQYRRLSHAGKAGLGSVIAALFGLVIASAGAAALARESRSARGVSARFLALRWSTVAASASVLTLSTWASVSTLTLSPCSCAIG